MYNKKGNDDGFTVLPLLEGSELVSLLPSLSPEVMLVTYFILAIVVSDQRLCLVPNPYRKCKSYRKAQCGFGHKLGQMTSSEACDW